MGELRRRHSHREESRLQLLLRASRFEIVSVLVAGIGLFLLVDRWSIRRTAKRWLDQAVVAMGNGLARIDQTVARFISETSVVNAAGFALIVVALVALFLRLRWRLTHSPRLSLLRCPRCGGDIHRVHRKFLDRLTRWLAPTRRYRCANRDCHWEGLRVTRAHATKPGRS